MCSVSRRASGVNRGLSLALVLVLRWYQPGHRLGEPSLSFLCALPPLGYIGLLIIWFGIGDASKVWLLFLAAFPLIALATIDGVRGVERDKALAARTLGRGKVRFCVR